MREIARDVVVIGAGPAGMAAADALARSKTHYAVFDEQYQPGGQIHRAELGNNTRYSTENFFGNCTIFDAIDSNTLLARQGAEVVKIKAQKIILATGARELFLPFPGWTLPNVMGAGGLQALVKSGLNIDGKRILVAGSGPLLLAVADYLDRHGATVVGVAEQASRISLAKFGAGLVRWPKKVTQTTGFAKIITKVKPGTWIVEAQGRDKLERVELSNGESLAVDYIANSYGLVPNLELPMLLGCSVKDGFVQVDDNQQTTIPGVFAVGELTGIGGIEKGILEGQRAAGKENSLDSELKFMRALAHAFALRPEVLNLAKPDTIICRCEDVRLKDLEGSIDARDAKIHTRCGMGPCQGRICGAALRTIKGWEHDTIRPPLTPISLEALANISVE